MRWFLALLLCLASSTILASSSRVYTGDPLPVLLPLGKERRIEIEGAQEVRVGLSAALKERLRAESAGPHVWLTARDALSLQRVYLKTETELLVLKVRTDPQAPTEPLSITVDLKGSRSSPSFLPDRQPSYVALMRYAIQALYAPDYREDLVSKIRQVLIDEQPVALFRCRETYPSACGDAVESIPHAAWEALPYYITAVTVRNRLPESLTLDPRDLRGRFAASAIVHPRLEASGSVRDTTTVVLISSVPFEHAQ